MKPRQQVSRAALELIKTFEGYRRTAAQLPDGRWTIGYGHTLTAREGAEVSEADAEALLLYDLIAVAHAVNEHVYTALSQNQFDGLACFAFNIGVENFRRSAVLRRVNEGLLLQAAYAMEMWRRADFEGERIVIDALVRRRSAEKTLFLTPEGGWAAAPTPVLPPKIDFELEPMAPREKPTAIRSSLDGPLAIAQRDESESLTALDVSLLAPAQPSAAEQAAAAVAARLEAIEPEPQVRTPSDVAAELEEAPPLIFEHTRPSATVHTLTPRYEAPAPVVEPELETVAVEPAPTSEPAPVVEAAAPPAEPEPTPEPEPEPEAVVASPPTRAESWAAPTLVAPTLAAPDPFKLSPLEDIAPAPVEAEPEAEVVPAGPSLFDAPLRPDNLGPPPPPSDLPPPERPRSNIIEGFDQAFPLQRVDTSSFPGLPLVALALVGLVIFSGGVFWGLNAAPDAAGGVPVAKTVGWVLGVIGVICFGLAAYGLLRRLGGEDEGEE